MTLISEIIVGSNAAPAYVFSGPWKYKHLELRIKGRSAYKSPVNAFDAVHVQVNNDSIGYRNQRIIANESSLTTQVWPGTYSCFLGYAPAVLAYSGFGRFSAVVIIPGVTDTGAHAFFSRSVSYSEGSVDSTCIYTRGGATLPITKIKVSLGVGPWAKGSIISLLGSE